MARKYRKNNKTPASKESDRKNSVNSKTNAVKPVQSAESTTANKEVGEDENKTTNDVAWYAKDPRLVLDAARIPWNKPFGTALSPTSNNLGINITLPNTNHDGFKIKEKAGSGAIPGICTLFCKPSFGTNTNINSPMNVCAQMLYTFVRHLNSGRKNYDVPDIMLYVSTFTDIYSFIEWMKRIYNAAYMYSRRNYYLGKAMLLAEHIDADSLVSELANFRYFINVCIKKVTAYAVPADITAFNRRAFLYRNTYIENPMGNIKDQLYQLSPDGFYIFDYDSANSSGLLKYKRINRSGSYLTIADFRNLFNSMMDKISGDEDFGIMSGDILKAYGGNILGLADQPEEGILVPTYDPIVLSQFKNADIVDVSRDEDAYTAFGHRLGDVFQDPSTGLLKSYEGLDSGKVPFTTVYVHADKAITVETPDPDVGDVLEATRLKVAATPVWYSENGKSKYPLIYSGTEICVRARFTTYHLDSSGNMVLYHKDENQNGMLIASDDPWSNPESVGLTSAWVRLLAMAFKYAPIHWLYHITDEAAGGNHTHELDAFIPVGNYDNTTMIGDEELTRIHEVALFSLFYVPGVAKVIS